MEMVPLLNLGLILEWVGRMIEGFLLLMAGLPMVIFMFDLEDYWSAM